MLKSTLFAGVAAIALTSPVLAQTGTQPTPGAQPPAQQQQQQPGGTWTQAEYLTAPQPGQFMASQFMDHSVHGRDGRSIGDINDVILDQGGNIVAVVIGVGGFLGIGEKDVAVPFRRLQIMYQGTGTGAGTTGTIPPGTGTAPPTGTAGTGGQYFTDNTRIVLDATRESLNNAPTFRARGDEGSATRGTTPGTAPRR